MIVDGGVELSLREEAKKCPCGSWYTVRVSKEGNSHRPWWRRVLWCGLRFEYSAAQFVPFNPFVTRLVLLYEDLRASSCRPAADAVPPPGRSRYWVGMSRERRSSPSGDTIISVTLVSKQQMAQLVTNICRRLDVYTWAEITHQTPRRILNICLNLISLRSLWTHDRPHRAAIFRQKCWQKQATGVSVRFHLWKPDVPL